MRTTSLSPKDPTCPIFGNDEINIHFIGNDLFIDDNWARLADAIAGAASCAINNKLSVMWARVSIANFKDIDEMVKVHEFMCGHLVSPQDALWTEIGLKPATITQEDANAAAFPTDNTTDTFAEVSFGPQHPCHGKYICVPITVSEGDWDEEVFFVTLLFVKQNKKVMTCSFKAKDQTTVDRFRKEIYREFSPQQLVSLKMTIVEQYEGQVNTPWVQIESDRIEYEEIEALLKSIPDMTDALSTLKSCIISDNVENETSKSTQH